jgi:hypothetical protein
MHVAKDGENRDLYSRPHVRELLALWMNPLASHECDLMVVATHHRTALMRLVSGSVAAGVSDDSRVPALFLRDDSKGFIDLVNGACHLETVLIPVGGGVALKALGEIADQLLRLRCVVEFPGLAQRTPDRGMQSRR